MLVEGARGINATARQTAKYQFIYNQYVIKNVIFSRSTENVTTLIELVRVVIIQLPGNYIMKTHVRGFFDTDLHEVSWHFETAEWVLSSTDRVKISVKEAIQNGFLFLSHT